MKKLALKKDALGDLRSDELVQVAGGTTATLNSCNPRLCGLTIENTRRICYQSLDECLSVRFCVNTLPESECVCLD